MREEMDIRFVIVWGVYCLVIGIMDLFSFLIGELFTLLSLDLLQATVASLVPFAYFVGAACAWEIFAVHEARGGMLQSFFQDGKLDAEMAGAAAKGVGAQAGAAMTPAAAA